MNKNIDKILSFSWVKTIILIALGFAIIYYATGESYTCISEIDGILIDAECARLNFLPHLFVKIGTVILFSPIITIIYSVFKYSRNNKNSKGD